VGESDEVTRVTLFVPCTRVLAVPAGVAGEWIANDGAFGEAFSFGTVGRDLIAALDAAPGALVLHWPVDLRDGREQIVAAVARLRDAGALAVRLEQSKLGWDVASWLEHFGTDDPAAWHRGGVAFLAGESSFQSCGMHAFSLPDVRMELDGGDPSELQELATLLDLYQLVEDPVIRSGQTFAPDRETPRRVVERWPDTNYPPDHACHNPFGVWRLGPPGGTARPLGELVPVFMPTLHVLLEALAGEAAAPLTRAQVEGVRDRGVCIAMEPRDAQRLERTRGYADLDPELAWEQWLAVTASR
jgi:uncharacterized protein DUF4261